MYLKVKSYNNGKPVLFGLNSMRAPYSVVMSATDIQPDADNKRLVTEGSFIVGVGDYVRYLPRTKTKNAIATNSPTITLKAPSYSFKTGDVLYAQAGYAELVISGTPVQNDVIIVSINGTNYSYTVGASPTIDTVVDGFISDNSAALLADLGITFTQRGTTGSIIITSIDAYKVDTYSSNGNLQVRLNSTEPGYLGDSIVPLGTISSIAAANTAGERVVTLAANAAYALPANSNIGVYVSKFLGIYPDPMDFTEEPVMHVAPIVEADGVYEQNLPYIDLQLKRIFNQLRIDKRFYRSI